MEMGTPYHDINNRKEELNKTGATNVISHDLKATPKTFSKNQIKHFLQGEVLLAQKPVQRSMAIVHHIIFSSFTHIESCWL